MRFIMPSYLYSTAFTITEARIKIRQYIGTTPQAKAYRVLGSWTSGSLTWNNKPSYTTSEASGLATLDSDNWYNFIVTTIIKKQLNGTYGDYGVMLKDNTESGTQHWSTFYSSEAASPNKPELHIMYTANDNQYLSYGYGSSTIDIKTYSFNVPWSYAADQSRASWNNSGAGITFNVNSSLNTLNLYSDSTDNKYGYMIPISISGDTLVQFEIYLNRATIISDATNLDNFIQSVLVHELGHTIWLEDNPVTSSASIMKYSRDRNSMISPSPYDVSNVAAKY